MRTVSGLRFATVAALAAAVGSCQSGTEPGSAIDHLEISLTPTRASYPPGDTLHATVVALSKEGTWLRTGSPQWRSLEPDIAGVLPSGRITARSRGEATIEAEVDGVTAQVRVQVRGVLHTVHIDVNETWRAADTPHVVQGYLNVGGFFSLDAKDTATLTIEPGATVRFRSGSGLYFADIEPGRLVIPAAGDRVVMEGDSTARGSWVGLAFLGYGRSELRNVTLRHCGANSPSGGTMACLTASGNYGGRRPELLIDDVTITDAHHGVDIGHWVTMAPGSRVLSVENTDGRKVTLSPQVLATFPRGGRFAGNSEQEIRVTNGLVERSGTWSSLGLPLRLMGEVLLSGADWPTITVPGGVVLRADPGAGITEEQGRLLVGDSAGLPVILESTGDGWQGIALGHGGSAIRNAEMRDCGLLTQACLEFNGPAEADSGLIVQDLAIRSSRSAGVRAGGRFNPSSRNLTITESAGVPLEVAADVVPSIPPGDYRLNATNAIRVWNDAVWRSATWRDHGLPYLLPVGLVIGAMADRPTLTLEPGVILQMGIGTNLLIGEGALRAVGTGVDPILFTSATPDVAGSWGGIDASMAVDAGTRLEYVEIHDAGAYGGAMRMWVDPGGVLRNSTIRRSPHCGIIYLGTQDWADDYTDPAFGNSFIDVDGPARCRPPG